MPSPESDEEAVGAALPIDASPFSGHPSDPSGSPTLERVDDGIWLIRVPFLGTDLASCFAYLVVTEEGLVLVDAGFATEDGWEILSDAAYAIGSSPEAVVCVLLTHLHPDHVGLADRIREASGAWIGAHPREVRNAQEMRRAMSADGADDVLRACGMNHELRREVAGVVAGKLPPEAMPRLDRWLEDGEEIIVGERHLHVVLTPGHAPGHLVFHERARSLLFAGDLLLPRTTPHIGADPRSARDPLGDFFTVRATRGPSRSVAGPARP